MKLDLCNYIALNNYTTVSDLITYTHNVFNLCDNETLELIEDMRTDKLLTSNGLQLTTQGRDYIRSSLPLAHISLAVHDDAWLPNDYQHA